MFKLVDCRSRWWSGEPERTSPVGNWRARHIKSGAPDDSRWSQKRSRVNQAEKLRLSTGNCYPFAFRHCHLLVILYSSTIRNIISPSLSFVFFFDTYYPMQLISRKISCSLSLIRYIIYRIWAVPQTEKSADYEPPLSNQY